MYPERVAEDPAFSSGRIKDGTVGTVTTEHDYARLDTWVKMGGVGEGT
jgi:hypothetical protein